MSHHAILVGASLFVEQQRRHVGLVLEHLSDLLILILEQFHLLSKSLISYGYLAIFWRDN